MKFTWEQEDVRSGSTFGFHKEDETLKMVEVILDGKNVWGYVNEEHKVFIVGDGSPQELAEYLNNNKAYIIPPVKSLL